MKRFFVLVLSLVLLLTSVAVIAEGDIADADVYELPVVHATPHVNSFARIKVQYDEAVKLYTLTLSKPVDRILINWAEPGAEPEEVYFNDELVCYVFATGHKYRPGVEQRYVTDTTVETVTMKYKLNNETGKQEVVVDKRVVDEHKDPITRRNIIYKTVTIQPVVQLNYNEDFELKIAAYMNEFPGLKYEIVRPDIVYFDKEVVDAFGNKITVKEVMHDDNGNVVYSTGYIKGYSEETEFSPVMGTTVYGSKQIAFMTVQGEWAVYYNLKGTIVDVLYYEGQF